MGYFTNAGRYFQAKQRLILLAASFWLFAAGVQAQQPQLRVEELASQQIRLSWPQNAGAFVLESAARLTDATVWSPVLAAPVPQGADFALVITPTAASQFFRLRQLDAEVFTRILESSPSHGEGGIAVTRETILRFSEALSSSAVITTAQLYAEFGGRKILSRVQISSDRRSVTLFYLEPLPASARIRVTFLGDGIRDAADKQIDADGDGVAGGTAVIDFDTLSITPVGATAVVGRVFASELMTDPNGQPVSVNRPLAGVTITVDGAEQNLRATTDAQGNFKLQPAPAGRFFVQVDGRTADGSQWPDGAYYPVVGKAWEAVAGREDNLAGGSGEIFLPLIQAGTLQPVSATQETTITFPAEVIQENPALNGVAIMVPPNSLLSDNGNIGGKVGIAPVPPDRLPEPLPPGLDFPLVITVQTDGPTNFDVPVPVRFPNLPDPVTGQPLPPGAKSALWSFNHDTGRWEIQGSMTVSADGRFVETDAGVGIRQPGWHGTRPGTPGRAGPPVRQPPCPDLSAWQVAELVFNIGKEAADCAAGLAGVKQGLQCVINAVKTGGNLLIAVKKVIEDVTSRPPVAGMQVIRDAISQVKAQKEQMIGLMDCVQAQSPIGKAEAIFNCVGNVLGIGQNVCGALNPDPNAPPHCQPSTATKFICKGIDVVKTLHSGVADIIKILKDAQEKLALTAVCVGLNQAEAIVGSIVSSQQNSLRQPNAVTDPFPADRLDEFVAALRHGEREMVIFLEAAAPAEEALARLENFEGSIKEFREEAGKAVRSQGEAYQAPVHYLIRYGNIERRGKTSAQGTFDIILPPDTEYFLAEYDPATNTYGDARNFTSGNGQPTELLPIILTSAQDLPDRDNDGLADAAEAVAGTDPAKADTDGDGISDLAELRQGSNPLGGIIAATGVIASAGAPGNAVDISVVDDIAITANEEGGVTVFNVFSGLNPTVIAQVPTPGEALRVASAGRFAAVAMGGAGLAVIDLADPPAARVAHQISLGSSVLSAAAAGGFAYAGTSRGEVVLVELSSGAILGRADLQSPVKDLSFGGDYLYALTERHLHALEYLDGSLAVAGAAESPSPSSFPNLRLFVGGNAAWATHGKGCNTFDLSTPGQPRLIAATDTQQFGWKQMVLNGAGLGLAAVSPNSTFDGPHNVSLYNTSDPAVTEAFLAEFVTPGIARAVAIYNGLGYVADGPEGLQVLHYQPFDAAGVPPSIRLRLSTTEGFAEEGKLLRISADVSDDTQVRNVEFYLNGELAATDGGFPFETRLFVPASPGANEMLRLRAKATDTGGNAAWTEEQVLRIIPDATPPRVRRTLPFDGALSGAVRSVAAFLSEPLDPASITPAAMRLSGAGADGQLGTADDTAIAGVIEHRSALNAIILTLPDRLEPGNYRLVLSPPLRDFAGNALAAPYTADFRVFSFVDEDQDGMPDELEAALGLDPTKADSNGNGVLDGFEDRDNDGLPNAGEVFAETNPSNRDSDGDGILDGAEDPDGDALSNAREFLAGTLPLAADTDRDGWNDETEVTSGSDPLNPASRPRIFITGTRGLSVQVQSIGPGSVLGAGVHVARPSLSVLAPSPFGGGPIPGGSYVARPPVSVVAPSAAGLSPGSVTVARPPVSVTISN